jgi:glycosyltransferase involved in cell wall biosynthesis
MLIITGPLGPHNPANIHYFDRLKTIRSELGLEGAVHFLAEYTQEYLPDNIIADFYRLADALLFPSREEGFGIPILEAGLAGLVIFSADIPPLVELGGTDVRYFSPNDSPSEVARMIGQTLSKDAVFRMRARVRKAYTWDRIFYAHIAPLLAS